VSLYEPEDISAQCTRGATRTGATNGVETAKPRPGSRCIVQPKTRRQNLNQIKIP
jgi:hypothetical protein